MPEAILNHATCSNCGVAVREHTQFCYNCGNSVADDLKVESSQTAVSNGLHSANDAESRDALDDLAKRLKDDELTSDKLAKAAARRRKARAGQRKTGPKQVVWEPVDELSAGLIILLAIMICAITALIVYLVVL